MPSCALYSICCFGFYSDQSRDQLYFDRVQYFHSNPASASTSLHVKATHQIRSIFLSAICNVDTGRIPICPISSTSVVVIQIYNRQAGVSRAKQRETSLCGHQASPLSWQSMNTSRSITNVGGSVLVGRSGWGSS